MTIDVRARRTERRLGVLALLAVALTFALVTPTPTLGTPMLGTPLFGATMLGTTLVLAAVSIGLGLWRQGWLGGKRRLTAISWLADGRWLLADADHASTSADLRADSRVGGRWVWLRWDTACSPRPRRRSLLLFGGDIPDSDLRRLVVRLRLAAHPRIHADISGA